MFYFFQECFSKKFISSKYSPLNKFCSVIVNVEIVVVPVVVGV